MVYGNVNREAFLDVCKSLSEEQMDAVVMSHPAVFKSAVDFGGGASAPAKPAAKPRERKAPKAADSDVVAARTAMLGGANTSSAIMARMGLTDRATRAAIKALIESGEAEQVGKGRGAKYVLKAAA